MLYVENLRQALHQTMTGDEKVVVLGEDILDPYGGAFKVTQGLSTHFPTRVLPTPICEASIAGMAVGMALRGLRPVAEIMFGDFITLIADQLVNHAAKYSAMYGGKVIVPLVIRTAVGAGRGYGPTHSQSLERMFLGIPHLKIVAPSHVHDPGTLLQAAIADDEPVLFLEHKLLYPQKLYVDDKNGTKDRYPTAILRNYDPPTQPDVTLIAYGGISRLLVPLLSHLADEEIWLDVCLPSCISPVDEQPLQNSAQASGRVIILEESQATFGWGAEIAAMLYARLGNGLQAPIQRLGIADTVIPAAKALEDKMLISAEKIEAAIWQMLGNQDLIQE